MRRSKHQSVEAPEPTPEPVPCYVCKRYGVGMVHLGEGVQRHEACFPGSEPWCDFFESLPDNKRTHIGEILYKNRRKHAVDRKG